MSIHLNQDPAQFHRPTPRDPRQPSRHQAKRSANDVQVDPASSEVISNLLASLSSVSIDSDEPSPLVPRSIPRTSPSPRSARPFISSRQARPRDARDPSIDFPEIRHPPPPAVPIDLPPEGDVAQPPTVRTSRRPSGPSKVTAPKRSGPWTTQERGGHHAPAPPPPTAANSPSSRSYDQLPPPPTAKSRSKTSSGRSSSDEVRRSRALGQRDSLLSHRSKATKEKEREKTATPYPTETSNGSLPPPSSRFRRLLPRSANTYLSKPSSVATSIREDDETSLAGTPRRSLSQRTSAENFVVVHAGARNKKPGLHEGRKFIPSRSSSLRLSSLSPPESRILSRRSSRHSYHRSPETVPEEDVNLGEGEPAVQGLPRDEALDDLEEDNDVLRRIKELQLAKEYRQRMEAESEPVPDSPQFPIPPTTRPGSRLRQVFPSRASEPDDSKDEHHKQQPRKSPLLNMPDNSKDERRKQQPPKIGLKENGVIYNQTFLLPPGPNSPTTTTSAAPPTARRYFASALDSTWSGGGGLASSRTASPAASPLRSNSRRWSNAGTAPSRPSFHRRRSSDANGPIVAGPYVGKEGRSSIDSVNDQVRNFLLSPRLSQKIQLPMERRQISFSEVGDPNGHVVFCCVGMGLTRYVMAFYDELAASLKLRLITPERPGIGESGAYVESKAPLHWPDDVRAICGQLDIQDFSLLAHSAGAIYALATALSMPSRIRGRIQLLAPWIPPSQMIPLRNYSTTSTPASSLRNRSIATPPPTVPRSQRFLRLIPTPFLKLTNVGATRGSYNDPRASPTTANSSPWSRKSGSADSAATSRRPSISSRAAPVSTTIAASRIPQPHLEPMITIPPDDSMTAAVLSAGNTSTPRPGTPAAATASPTATPATMNITIPSPTPRQRRYDALLTPQIWDLATRGANPTVDLIVCLERQRPIGFRYEDVTAPVVIRHGTRDARVPVENVRWLGGVMNRESARGGSGVGRCEVRVLEGEGHGLMGSARVMGDVLAEVAAECVR